MPSDSHLFKILLCIVVPGISLPFQRQTQTRELQLKSGFPVPTKHRPWSALDPNLLVCGVQTLPGCRMFAIRHCAVVWSWNSGETQFTMSIRERSSCPKLADSFPIWICVINRGNKTVCQFWTSKGIETLDEISSLRGLLSTGKDCPWRWWSYHPGGVQ